MWEDKTGVSPIIAVILMVAITVVLAATIYVWVSGFGGGEQSSQSMDFTQMGGVEDNNATFRISSASKSLDWADLTFLLDGIEVDAVYLGVSGTVALSGDVDAGQYFIVEDTDCTDGATLEVVFDNSIIATENLDY